MTRRDDTQRSPELSAAIEIARQQWPDARALERVRAGVNASIAAPPASGIGGAKLLRRSLRGAFWRGGSALVLLAGGLFGMQTHGESTRARADAAAEPQPLPALVIASALPSPPAPPPLVIEPELDAPPVVEPRKTPRTRVVPKPVAPARAVNVSPEAELQLLRRAMAALKRQPSTSLTLTAEHARDYPQGIFGQEREVIAIDALLALQETAAAESRARTFLSTYPRSSHAPRIRLLLGARPDDAAPLRAERAAGGAP